MTAFPLAGSPARAAVVHYDVTALLRGTQAPSVALVGRGPAAADQAQDALARLVKRSIAEALAQSKSRLPEIGHEPRSAEHRAIARLTQREVELLRLLASGDSNAGIGQRLGISADAAKFRVVALTRKLGLKNRTQAAVFAARNGLVD